VKTLRYFFAAYPARCIAVLVWLLVAGVTEGLGLSTLLPLLSVATGSTVSATGYEGRVTSALAALGSPRIGRAGRDRDRRTLDQGHADAALEAAGRLCGGADRYRPATATVARAARGALELHVAPARGRAANAMATEADRASYAFEYLALIASYSVETVVYLAIACAVSWRGTLLASAAAGCMLALLGALVRMAHRAGRKQTALLDSLLTRMTDTLGAVKLLKATGRESSVGPLLSPTPSA
jgi:ATP-binding cassette subfamily C protein